MLKKKVQVDVQTGYQYSIECSEKNIQGWFLAWNWTFLCQDWKLCQKILRYATSKSRWNSRQSFMANYYE